MLKRIQSAISTAHALSLAIREAPDAIRECVALVRENSGSLNELASTRLALESIDAECCKWRVKCDALAREFGAAQKERDELKARAENQASETAALRNRVTELVCGRGDFRAKLARHEAAERWHQVTAGEGELPPSNLDVIYKLSPLGANVIGAPSAVCDTYAWRYLSSQDAPQ